MRFRDNEYRKNLPSDYIFWVLGSMKPYFEQPDSELLPLDKETVFKKTLTLTQDWDPSFKVLFDMQDVNQTAILKTLSAKPDLPIWESNEKVTLIGDAAHPMSPTAGVGAATALKSAAAFAKVIKEE